MAYSADTFVADEQPTTAKWNKLWTNDASFNDGTGIATGAITSAKISGLDKSLLTTDSNPYKFKATKTTAQNTVAGSFTKILLNSETFDTNSNYDNVTNYRYTSPVSGFYQFGAGGATGASGSTIMIPSLYKNGAESTRGIDHRVSAASRLETVADFYQLTAADYMEFFIFSDVAIAMDVSATTLNYFSGYLVSRT